MYKRATSVFLFICVAASQAIAQSLVKNVNVIDVVNRQILSGYDVVSVNGSIIYVGKGRQYKLAPGTTVVDGTGKYLIPGLTDAHVHFFQSGGLFARPDAIDLRKYQSFEDHMKYTHEHMKDFLALYLKAGITSVIDVGASLEFLKQRDTFNGKPTSPLIYMTGPLLTTYVPEAFKNLQHDALFSLMTSEQDSREAVRKQLPYKPDFIKIWYIVLDSNEERGARANLKFVLAGIDEAHKNHLRVAVHATERITAQLAVEGGADYLVHDIDNEVVTDSFVKLLKSKGTVLCPTLVVAGNYRKSLGGTYQFTADELNLSDSIEVATIKNYPMPDTATGNRLIRRIHNARYTALQKTADSIAAVNLKKLVDGGVIIATGTDAGNIGTQHAGSYFNELSEMQKAGMNLWQILVASTINGAKSIGKEREWGSIEKGKLANMVILNSNPLEKLANWRDINTVINKGTVYPIQGKR